MNKYLNKVIAWEKKRNEIYKYYKNTTPKPSYMDVAIKFGMTPQRVGQIVKTVEEELGLLPRK